MIQRGGQIVSTELNKIRDSFSSFDPNLWDVSIGTNDFVEYGGNAQGSGYMKISKSLDTEDTETVITSKFIVQAPFRSGFGMSLSQRLQHQRFTMELLAVDDNGKILSVMPVSTPIQITNLSQTTTTLTVTTAVPHGFTPNDRVELFGINDSRFNYGEVLVATVVDRFNFTVTATIYTTIASLTASVAPTSGSVVKIDVLSYVNNALALTWEGQSQSNAKVISRSDGGPIYNTSDISMGNTTATIANTNAYADAFNPAFFFDLRYKFDGVVVRAMPLDSTNGPSGTYRRTEVVPDNLYGYKIRFRARNNKALSKPIATIKQVSKSGTTTATVTTNAPHGLTVADVVTIYGIRDQVNFANVSTTAIASIVDANTFTIAFGAVFTGTSNGGVISKVNGSYAVSNPNLSIQSIQRTGNLMTVIGSTNWSGFSIGETVDLRGLFDSSQVSYSQYETSYKVASISTTTLILYSNGPDFGLISCGGAVIKRTDFRMHFFRVYDYTRSTVEVDGSIGNYGDAQEALPVGIISIPAITVASGQGGHNSTIAGNPVRLGGRALTANYAPVLTGQTADLVTTLVGSLVTKPFAIPEQEYMFTLAAPISGNADTLIKAAPAAGIRNYLTSFQAINTSVTPTEFVIKDGATPIFRSWLPANMTMDAMYSFQTPLRATPATALNFACITPSANVYVNAQGYIAP